MEMQQLSNYILRTFWGMPGNNLTTGNDFYQLLLQLLFKSIIYPRLSAFAYEHNESSHLYSQEAMPYQHQSDAEAVVYEIDNQIKIQLDIPASINPQRLHVSYNGNRLIIHNWSDGGDKIIQLEGEPAIELGTVTLQGRLLEIVIPRQAESTAK